MKQIIEDVAMLFPLREAAWMGEGMARCFFCHEYAVVNVDHIKPEAFPHAPRCSWVLAKGMVGK